MNALLETLAAKTTFRELHFEDAWVLNTSPLFDGPSEFLFRRGIPDSKNPLFVHFGGGAFLSLLAAADFAASGLPVQIALINAEDDFFVKRNSALSGLAVHSLVWNPGDPFPEEWQTVDRVFIRIWKHMDLNLAWLRALSAGLGSETEIHLLGGNDDGIRNIKTRIERLTKLKGDYVGCHSRWLCVRAGDIAQKIEETPDFAGIFGGGAADKGTSLLLAHAGDLQKKSVCDLGSGSGVIAEYAANAGAAHVMATDNQYLAVTYAAKRLSAFSQITHRTSFIGDDIEEKFDIVLTNPPFHLEGRTRLYMGALWLKGARRLLKKGGEIRLVANEFLDYRTFAADNRMSCESIAHEKGFRIYRIKEL